MGDLKEPSKDGLNNLFKRSKGLSRVEAAKKYHALSEKAREDVNREVNLRFRDITHVSKDFKLDPKNPDHREYVKVWLSQRDIVMGWSVDWEKEAGKNYDTSYFSHDEKTIEKLKRDSSKLSSTERSANAILRQEFTGEEFKKYIEVQNKKPYADPVEVAYNIVRYAENRHLYNASVDKVARVELLKLFDLIASKPDDPHYIKQANRIMAAFGAQTDPSRGLIEKTHVLIPAEFTLFDSAHITARLTKDNKIWVKLTQHSTDGHPEAKMLGSDAFTKGIIFEPHEWIRFKLYDEGGVIVCRPAMYLLQLSHKSTQETWSNMINVGSLGIPGGAFFKVGGLVAKTGARALAVLAKLEKIVDVVANGLIIGNIAVRENRGWIIKNYSDNGRKFIEYFDLASTLAVVYGVSKAMTTSVMKGALKEATSNWDEIKKLNIDPEDMERINEIDKSVNKFKEALREADTLDDTTRTLKEGLDETKQADELKDTAKLSESKARTPDETARLRDESTSTGRTRDTQSTRRISGRTVDDSDILFRDTFTDAQVRNWSADNFWKSPEDLKRMRGREGFTVVIDKDSNEVIAAYLDYSENGLTTGVRADGISKLYDAKFDLVVRPNVRGRHVGGEVLKKVLEKAKGHGAEHIRVHASNSDSYRWFSRMNPVSSTVEGEGGRHVFRVDDLETRLRPRETGTPHTPEVPTRALTSIGGRLDSALKQLEAEPELEIWRNNRRVTADEFEKWVKNLPEDSQREFLQRLQEVPRTDSVGNKRFVLRDAAHEIRVNRDLKAVGINEIHGDFSGSGSKLEKRVADALSSSKRAKESTMVRNGIMEHNLGRSHHNPKTADDYIHKALDEYDAVTDPLRDKSTDFGYRDPPMTNEDIRKVFVDNSKKGVLDRKAMEIVLDWKEGRISPERVRSEYKTFYDKVKSLETQDTVKLGPPDKPTPPGGDTLPDLSPTLKQPVSDSFRKPVIDADTRAWVGDSVADKAADIGMSNDHLGDYYEFLSMKTAKFDTKKMLLGDGPALIQKAALDEIERSISTIGKENTRTLISYGLDPHDITTHIDSLVSQGLTQQAIRGNFANEIKLMNYLRDNMLGGSQEAARISVRVSGAEGGIKNLIWDKLVEEYKTANPQYHELPTSMLGDKWKQIGDKATKMTEEVKKEVLGASTHDNVSLKIRDKSTKTPQVINRDKLHITETKKDNILKNKNRETMF